MVQPALFPNLLVLAAGVVKSMLLLKLLVAPSVPNGRRPPVPMDDGRLLGKLILYGLGTNQRLWINWIFLLASMAAARTSPRLGTSLPLTQVAQGNRPLSRI